MDSPPRQTIPLTQSHQNLAQSVSRPLPPSRRGPTRSASNTYSNARSASASSSVISSGRNSDEFQKHELSSSAGGEATAFSSDHFIQDEIPKEEIEKALEGLSRDDLVMALGRAKVQMDELDARLEAQILAYETLQAQSSDLYSQLNLSEAEAQSLQLVVKQREERIDEMMADQDRMESEVYSTMQVIDRLRKQLADCEKSRSDAEKRYMDQAATMDKERQYYADTEALLKSQKASQVAANEKLSTANHELSREYERLLSRLAHLQAMQPGSSSAAHTFDEPSQDISEPSASAEAESNGDGSFNEDVPNSMPGDPSGTPRLTERTLQEESELATVKEELSSIQRSHESLTETMHKLQAELKDVKALNATLRDQNETFIDILQEKTFSGALLEESAVLNGGYRGSISAGSVSTEESGSDLEGDVSQGASSSGGVDEDDVPDTPRAPTSKIQRRKRRDTVRNQRSSSNPTGAPTNLANELEATGDTSIEDGEDGDADERRGKRKERRNERGGAVSDNVQELQQEVRELREANQALTLYISKIIDRIISKEGYENVLAADGKATSRGGMTRRSKAHSRPSLASSALADSPNLDGPHQRRQGAAEAGLAGGIFSFGSGSASAERPAAEARSKPKRGGSIDWRSLPFLGGGSSSSQGNETKPGLKPLALQGSSPLLGTNSPQARRVRASEEIEDEADIEERERIRRELLKRGIEPPKHQLVPQSPTNASQRRESGAFAAFFSRVVSGNSNASTSSSFATTEGSAKSGAASSSEASSRISSISIPDRSQLGVPSSLTDPGKRLDEKQKALDVGGTGDSLTELKAGLPRSRTFREQRATNMNMGLGSSTSSSASTSVTTSRESSFIDSSFNGDESIAGDESYSLPPPTNGLGDRKFSGGGDVSRRVLSSAGASPAMSTSDLPSIANSSETDETSAGGWKKAFKRMTILSGSTDASSSSPQNGNAPLPDSESSERDQDVD
ncbi:hypothetical protein IE53DRAFT_250647 [Violaceomyces palustris]|uniref:Uncharacterized protein n=1 Tax=Violaceomyces palustris TaxID=1673888 RepID=A0ACD0P417_9BASI|nr:hypothetical protein IE53DRAFT_250647 [Violaceomyces palustris]